MTRRRAWCASKGGRCSMHPRGQWSALRTWALFTLCAVAWLAMAIVMERTR